jgi:S-DNA-T family DNA segregation ATPase FtsK/SpoIIIE
MPYLVLLIDGWEAVSGAWESVEHGRPVDVLQQLMRDGPGVGLHVVVSGDRSLVTSRMASLVSDKLILRLADPVDLALAGIPTAVVPGHLPAGRGLRSIDQAEIQIALLDPDPSGAAQIAALDRIAARARAPRSGAGPIRIEPLPTHVSVAELARTVGESPPGWALVGAGGDAGDPVGLSIRGTSTLIAGPARSGRTTALRTMSAWLGKHGQDVVLLTPGPSALAELAGRPGIAGVVESAEMPRLHGLLTQHPNCCVVVDDVERLLGTEADDVVTQWFKSAERVAWSLLVAGNATELSSMFRGLSVLARRSGQGVLLQPTSYADGDLLGIRLPTTGLSERISGRGILVRNGSNEPVQVASSN